MSLNRLRLVWEATVGCGYSSPMLANPRAPGVLSFGTKMSVQPHGAWKTSRVTNLPSLIHESVVRFLASTYLDGLKMVHHTGHDQGGRRLQEYSRSLDMEIWADGTLSWRLMDLGESKIKVVFN